MGKTPYISFVPSTKRTLNTVHTKQASVAGKDKEEQLAEETSHQQYKRILESEPSAKRITRNKLLKNETVKGKPDWGTTNQPTAIHKPKDIFNFAQNNKVKECKEWLQMKLDVNERDEYGWTALMVAACAGHASIVQLLLEAGANMSLVNPQAQTATDFALKYQHRDVVDAIRSHHELKSVNEESSSKKPSFSFNCDTCLSTYSGMSVFEHQLSIEHQLNYDAKVNEEKPKGLSKSQASYGHLDPSYKGLQLLLKEGWSGHTGLGRNEDGRTQPVIPKVKSDRAGLGCPKPPTGANLNQSPISLQRQLLREKHLEQRIRSYRRQFYD